MPVCIAECRSVRVTRVLDASRNLLVLVMCWLLDPYGCRLGNAWVTAAVRLDTCSLP